MFTMHFHSEVVSIVAVSILTTPSDGDLIVIEVVRSVCLGV